MKCNLKNRPKFMDRTINMNTLDRPRYVVLEERYEKVGRDGACQNQKGKVS
jgi:hypothetical protein